MSLLKQKILESAIRFFSEKGYMATSVQDIADDCGIAKGSLYKFFSSKEELFIEVYHSRQTKFLNEIEDISKDPSLSAREIFIRETEYQFEFFLKNQFFMQDIKEMAVCGGEIASFLFQLRINLVNMNKDILIRRFGQEIEPNVWDLVLIYNGIVRAYFRLLAFEKKPLIIRNVAVYIVDRFEDVVASVLAMKPEGILNDAIMNDYVQLGCGGKVIPVAEQRKELFETLLITIRELDTTNFRKKELHDAIMILREETQQERPKSVLIQAMLNYLEQEHALKEDIGRLGRLIDCN